MNRDDTVYLRIDLDTVWDITQRDVPELKRAVEKMLSASQEKDNGADDA